jgi:Ca2+-binding EF-hand superfamily protein
MQKKSFKLDKQEYQSVFRVLDKDNMECITIKNVNSYIEKLDQLH